MSLEDLIIRLAIKEDSKSADRKANGNSKVLGANIIETTPPNQNNIKRSPGPKNYSNKKKFKDTIATTAKRKDTSVQ